MIHVRCLSQRSSDYGNGLKEREAEESDVNMFVICFLEGCRSDRQVKFRSIHDMGMQGIASRMAPI